MRHLLVVPLSALASSVAAQTVRLNGPLAQPRVGDVQDFALSPDGTRVVYRADVQRAGQYELFSAPLDGSEPAVRLHAPTTLARRQVLEFVLGAGGNVAFRGDLDGDDIFKLYGAPITGSAGALVLSGALTGIDQMALTPDGTRVVFSDGLGLYSVPIDGSAAPLALAPQPASGHSLFRITPDGARVVFTRKIGDVEYLGRVALDGSLAPLLLANSGSPNLLFTYFGDVTLGADSVHGAYVPVDQFLDFGNVSHAGLYGFTVDKSHPPARLHLAETQDALPAHAVAGERVIYTEPDGTLYTIRSDGTGRVALALEVSEFTLSPDTKTIAFVRGLAPASELCVAPWDGSEPALVLAGPGTLAQARFSENSGLVYFLATDPVDSFRGLYAVPTDGGVPLLLNGPAVPGPLGVVDFAVAPSGSRVVYREERAEDEVVELWSVGLDLVPHRLSGPLGGFRDVLRFALAPDGETVAYVADQESEQTNEVFAAPIDGSLSAVKLNDDFSSGPVVGDVSAFQATRDGKHVVYTADQDVDEFRELYAVPTDSVRAPVRLSAPFQDDADVHSDVTLLPQSARVVAEYRTKGDSLAPFSHRLLSCALSGAEPALLLDSSPRLDRSSDVFSSILAAPDESFLVYEKLVPDGSELSRVDLDGSQAPLTLLTLDIFGFVRDARITPDGQAVVVLANIATVDSYELFRVECDGSAPPLRLHAPLTGGKDVSEFALSADGSRIVFRGAVERTVADLYSVPIDGSAAPRRLNSSLAAVIAVQDFLLASGSAELVYLVDGGVFYRVPADGSVAAQFLLDLPNGSLQPEPRLSPDGQHVFYRAEALGLDIVELFALRTSGGSLVKLSGPMVTGGEVTSFAQSPSGTRVVYLADQRAEGRFELFSATLTTPGQPLWPTPIAGSDVTAFQIDRESRFVVFLLHTGSATAGLDALYRVRLDASAPPELIHLPLAPDGDVKPDFLTLPRGRVVYRADATDEVFELFEFQPRSVRRR
ncbi:MAG: hypothetical protein ABL998_07080 [Planctomycetota bacterium]